MKWISVECRLPEAEGEYLVYADCKSMNGVYIANYRPGDSFTWYPFIKSDVTHWMLLPAPPESEE
jgi:hypothetical protein